MSNTPCCSKTPEAAAAPLNLTSLACCKTSEDQQLIASGCAQQSRPLNCAACDHGQLQRLPSRQHISNSLLMTIF